MYQTKNISRKRDTAYRHRPLAKTGWRFLRPSGRQLLCSFLLVRKKIVRNIVRAQFYGHDKTGAFFVFRLAKVLLVHIDTGGHIHHSIVEKNALWKSRTIRHDCSPPWGLKSIYPESFFIFMMYIITFWGLSLLSGFMGMGIKPHTHYYQSKNPFPLTSTGL